jgi:succinylglutamic semialdehyde dehydrogenase
VSAQEPNLIGERWVASKGAEVDTAAAVAAGAKAFGAWSSLPLEVREKLLQGLAAQYRLGKEKIAETICRETGKPRWESLAEVDAMIAKVAISIDAYHDRCGTKSQQLAGATGSTRYRPHGVLAIFGPFNMPGHLPNGHLIPALLAGNTIVLKPSEKTPLSGRAIAEACLAAKLPPGVVNLVQGGPETGAALAKQKNLNGILFTGSSHTGRALSKLLAEETGKILALEMGGNNPLVVHEVADLDAATIAILQSAFITAGQRCSCARRLILVRGPQADALVQKLLKSIAALRIGFWDDDVEPFMGPVIDVGAAEKILLAQKKLLDGGALALALVSPSPRSAALLSPGLIDVTPVTHRPDEEIFGPLLQLIFVDDFEAAICEANRTNYGLSAGLISDKRELYEQFQTEIRAGVVHWNRPLTGASSHLPFGGIGESGNHRPGAYFAADYSAYPVATLESGKVTMPEKLPPGLAPARVE